jgi:hypothetical protein
MTEAEWIDCADPTPMLEFLRGRASERKLLLFVSHCMNGWLSGGGGRRALRRRRGRLGGTGHP